MLVYLAASEAISEGHDTRKTTMHLIDLLRSDIPWPETYLTKTADIGFAKEALEAMALLTKSIKDDLKPAIRERTSKQKAARV
jgi:hypothetical protein